MKKLNCAPKGLRVEEVISIVVRMPPVHSCSRHCFSSLDSKYTLVGKSSLEAETFAALLAGASSWSKMRLHIFSN